MRQRGGIHRGERVLLTLPPHRHVNPKKRRGAYLDPTWHHFVKRKPRKNPSIIRNPGGRGLSMTTLLLVGGAAFVLLTPSGRAMMARFTGGAGMPPGGYPTGTVRLADGTYRLPSGQIVGTPTSGAGSNVWLAPLASFVPGVTSMIGNWIRGLTDGSSATTPVISTGVPIDSGGVTMGTPDILSGSYGWSMGDPLPALPDLTLQGSSPDFWSGIDTSGWWGNLGAPLSFDANPVPIVDMTAVPMDVGFFGFGRLGRLPAPRVRRLPASYR